MRESEPNDRKNYALPVGLRFQRAAAIFVISITGWLSSNAAGAAPAPPHGAAPAGLAIRVAGIVLPPHCASLAGLTIPAAAIGLPTRGAQIETATLISATQFGNTDGEYCRMTGIIRGMKDNTPDIRFEVNLPQLWNGRALQMGGGGYSGVVVSGTETVPFAPSVAPLAQGYATFGSDSGHDGDSSSANFARDDEAVVNFGYGHLKKTHDVALMLITLGYGRQPDKMYFAGGSTGGREGYTVAERFPEDYDGVIADSPALNFSGVRLIGVALGQAAYGVSGGFISRPLQKWLYARTMAACDALDGAVDGIISHVEACRAREPQIIASLRCTDSTDVGPSPMCLSDTQIHTLEVLSDGLTLPYSLAYGIRGYHGYNVFQGTNFSGMLGLGKSAQLTSPPTFASNGYLFAQGDAYLKYFVTRDASLQTLNFDLNHPGHARKMRLVELSDTVGAMNPDLSRFIERGGKLITLQGLADEVISPNQTIGFYHALVRRYSREQVDSFMRLYMVPGFGHGSGAFIPSVDLLGALDNWVTHGVAPETLIATDIAPPTNGRKRPLCRFPAFPRYSGKGNLNRASSFECALQ